MTLSLIILTFLCADSSSRVSDCVAFESSIYEIRTPVESVEPNNDISLEGFTSCPVSADTKKISL